MKWPAAKVSEHLFVEFMSPQSLNIQLQTPTPSARLYLRYINLSPAWVEVERLRVEIMVGYQELVSGNDLERYRLEQFSVMPPIKYGFDGMHDKKVYVELPIEAGRAANARDQVAKNTGLSVQLKLSVFGRCQTGRLEKTDLSFEMPIANAGITR